jgi:hypothetical protein
MPFSFKAISGKEPRVSITFAPDRPSADDFQQFLTETNYHHSPTKPLPSLPRPDVPDVIRGYVSPIQPKYFIWEAGSFREGSLVTLGSSTCVARVTKAQRVGRNYFLMGLENLGSVAGDVAVQGLVVSFPPSQFQLSFLQRIKLRFFRRFLRSSFRDFVDDQQVRGEEGPIFDSECLAVLEECLGDLFEEDLSVY